MEFHPFTKILMVISLLLVTFVLLTQRPVAIREELSTSPKIFVNFDKLTVEKEKCFAVFLIPTLPGKVKNRNTIRETWANSTAWAASEYIEEQFKNFKIMFVVGKITNKPYSEEFLDEVSTHNDIFIVSSLVEHRTVLKYKVLWGLKRSQQLYDYKFLIKTDDDILVNLPIVLENLKSMDSHMMYGGECFMEYGGFDGYPKWRYCSGGGYTLSYDMVSAMLKLDDEVHQVPFRPEDGYVGWLVYNVNKKLNFSLKVPKRFKHCLKTYGYKCGVYDHWFYHFVSKPGQMESLFHNVNTNSIVEC